MSPPLPYPLFPFLPSSAKSFVKTIPMVFSAWISFWNRLRNSRPILAAILKRSVSLWGSWKFSVAGLLPAAILMTVAIAAYALGQIRMPHLIGAWALHFVIGWIFIIGATFKLPERVKTAPNPFRNGGQQVTEPSAKNPFRGR